MGNYKCQFNKESYFDFGCPWSKIHLSATIHSYQWFFTFALFLHRWSLKQCLTDDGGDSCFTHHSLQPASNSDARKGHSIRVTFSVNLPVTLYGIIIMPLLCLCAHKLKFILLICHHFNVSLQSISQLVSWSVFGELMNDGVWCILELDRSLLGDVGLFGYFYFIFVAVKSIFINLKINLQFIFLYFLSFLQLFLFAITASPKRFSWTTSIFSYDFE